MKRVIIVHCWGGSPKYCWYPQTKKELEDKGFKVIVPEMPNTHFPEISLWLSELQQVADRPNEDLFLIGHSAGCIAILKYLEQSDENTKIGGVVLVAGFTESLGEGYEELENFFDKPIDFEKIKNKSKYFVAIHSDNDPNVPLQFGDILKDKLGAKLIVKNKMGHFSGPINEALSVTSLPDVSQEILRMSR